MRIPLMFTVAAMIAAPASAVTVQYRTTNLVAGQGFVSPFANAAGTANAAGVFEERFNGASTKALGTCKRQRAGYFKFGAGGSDDPTAGRGAPLHGIATAVGRSPGNRLPPGTNGQFAKIHDASADVDQSCYAFGPNYDPVLTNNGRLDPYRISVSKPGGSTASPTYLGFYLGSIDEYNTIALYKKDTPGSFDNNPLIIPGLGDQGTGIFDGQQLVSYLNLATPATPIAQYSSQYIEFFFAPGDNFSHLNVSTLGPNGPQAAFEFDNLAVGFNPVTPTGTAANPTAAVSHTVSVVATPEPFTAAAMLSGMAMLAFARRRTR